MTSDHVETLDPNIIESHHLQGLRYTLTQDSAFRDAWKSQYLKNQLVKNELERLGALFFAENLSVTLLKGFALLGDIYEDWGARFASDVDFLVRSQDFERLRALLHENSYAVVKEKKWLGNSFKYLFTKNVDVMDLQIEVHTRLFWHCESQELQTVTSPSLPFFQILNYEAQLLHLCGHLAFQHSFLKLFWLLDIEYYVKKNIHKIKWAEFWTLARQHELVLSCSSCLWLIDREVFVVKAPRHTLGWMQRRQLWFLKRLLNKKFLISPHTHTLRYLIVKNLIKDKIRLNFRYWSHWMFR